MRLPNWVGDVVMAGPALRALRERLPGVWIAWGCRPYVRRLLDAMPWKDEVLVEEGGRLGFVRRLRAGRFRTALLLPSSFGSAFEAWASGVPRRIGYGGHGRGCLLTDRLKLPAAPVYMGRLYGALAAVMTGEPPSGSMSLLPAPEDEARAGALWRELGLEGKRVVGLVPGASYGSAKCWPPGHFAALGRALAHSLLLYGPGEEGIAREVLSEAPGVLPVGPDKADLGVLVAVMKRLSVAVTNDTGPRHIAEALGVPTVTLVGPMDPRYTDSASPNVRVLREPVDCNPCNLRNCPIDHRCLARILPERVLEEVRKCLG